MYIYQGSVPDARYPGSMRCHTFLCCNYFLLSRVKIEAKTLPTVQFRKPRNILMPLFLYLTYALNTRSHPQCKQDPAGTQRPP